jgi:hypothetical protein
MNNGRRYIGIDFIKIIRYEFSSHPEKNFPDENTPIPAIIYGQKPPARLSRAPVKVDEIDRLKKDFWRELRPEIQVFPSGNSNFRMETSLTKCRNITRLNPVPSGRVRGFNNP